MSSSSTELTSVLHRGQVLRIGEKKLYSDNKSFYLCVTVNSTAAAEQSGTSPAAVELRRADDDTVVWSSAEKDGNDSSSSPVQKKPPHDGTNASPMNDPEEQNGQPKVDSSAMYILQLTDPSGELQLLSTGGERVIWQPVIDAIGGSEPSIPNDLNGRMNTTSPVTPSIAPEAGNTACTALFLHDDGNACMYNSDNELLWMSTHAGRKTAHEFHREQRHLHRNIHRFLCDVVEEENMCFTLLLEQEEEQRKHARASSEAINIRSNQNQQQDQQHGEEASPGAVEDAQEEGQRQEGLESETAQHLDTEEASARDEIDKEQSKAFPTSKVKEGVERRSVIKMVILRESEETERTEIVEEETTVRERFEHHSADDIAKRRRDQQAKFKMQRQAVIDRETYLRHEYMKEEKELFKVIGITNVASLKSIGAEIRKRHFRQMNDLRTDEGDTRTEIGNDEDEAFTGMLQEFEDGKKRILDEEQECERKKEEERLERERLEREAREKDCQTDFPLPKPRLKVVRDIIKENATRPVSPTAMHIVRKQREAHMMKAVTNDKIRTIDVVSRALDNFNDIEVQYVFNMNTANKKKIEKERNKHAKLRIAAELKKKQEENRRRSTLSVYFPPRQQQEEQQHQGQQQQQQQQEEARQPQLPPAGQEPAVFSSSLRRRASSKRQLFLQILQERNMIMMLEFQSEGRQQLIAEYWFLWRQMLHRAETEHSAIAEYEQHVQNRTGENPNEISPRSISLVRRQRRHAAHVLSGMSSDRELSDFLSLPVTHRTFSVEHNAEMELYGDTPLLHAIQQYEDGLMVVRAHILKRRQGLVKLSVEALEQYETVSQRDHDERRRLEEQAELDREAERVRQQVYEHQHKKLLKNPIRAKDTEGDGVRNDDHTARDGRKRKKQSATPSPIQTPKPGNESHRSMTSMATHRSQALSSTMKQRVADDSPRCARIRAARLVKKMAQQYNPL